MTTKLDIVTTLFHTVILPKPGNVLGITYPCFSIRYLCKLLTNYTLIAKSGGRGVEWRGGEGRGGEGRGGEAGVGGEGGEGGRGGRGREGGEGREGRGREGREGKDNEFVVSLV